ncbi:c6 zinc finger domain-containing protein [Stemphylium lycopersici]|uniref:C6 zinc finger domain-containing protein n=1 Tax=Stemphylium lycopersici TaxID=183478 RepID=A0A364N2W2_STELY|nr:c6 zinc finger domain-containing protein [Stemphylium lycopersici]
MDFWSGTVLRMAHSEPAVRNAMITLAHLNKSQCGSLAATSTAHQSAQFWTYYNKAVRALIDRMAESSYIPEVGLVTCILFACVEFLRVDTQNAITHTKNGLRIVAELRENHGAKAAMQREDARNSMSGPLAMIEKTLVPIFTQGLISALLCGVDTDTQFAFMSALPQQVHAQDFAHLSDARIAFWDLRNASILLARDMAIKMFEAIQPSQEDLERQRHVLACHHMWWKAMKRFEESQEMSQEERLDVSALKVGYYSTYTASACVNDARQMSFDAYLSDFKALLLHAKALVNALDLARTSHTIDTSSRAAANFTFDSSLIPPVYYTALRCRCPTTRREAIALLSYDLPREGLWDSEQSRIVAERVIEIEETEVDEKGWPVERVRLWSGAVTVDPDNDKRFNADFLFAKDVGKVSGKGWNGWWRLSGENKKSPSVAELYMGTPLQRIAETSGRQSISHV